MKNYCLLAGWLHYQASNTINQNEFHHHNSAHPIRKSAKLILSSRSLSKYSILLTYIVLASKFVQDSRGTFEQPQWRWCWFRCNPGQEGEEENEERMIELHVVDETFFDKLINNLKTIYILIFVLLILFSKFTILFQTM